MDGKGRGLARPGPWGWAGGFKVLRTNRRAREQLHTAQLRWKAVAACHPHMFNMLASIVASNGQLTDGSDSMLITTAARHRSRTRKQRNYLYYHVSEFD